jgi:hypothetical protein
MCEQSFWRRLSCKPCGHQEEECTKEKEWQILRPGDVSDAFEGHRGGQGDWIRMNKGQGSWRRDQRLSLEGWYKWPFYSFGFNCSWDRCAVLNRGVTECLLGLIGLLWLLTPWRRIHWRGKGRSGDQLREYWKKIVVFCFLPLVCKVFFFNSLVSPMSLEYCLAHTRPSVIICWLIVVVWIR